MINETNIAYMCPECENINLFRVNIFSFSGNRKKTFTCGCGRSEITFVKNANKSIKTDFICPICNEKHSFVIPSNQFWSSGSFSFPCTYYEATSLIIGKGEELENALKCYMENELEQDTSDISSNEHILMDKLLSFAEDIDKNADKYRFCDCNASYSCAYNENSIYIICDKCNYSKKISYEELFKNG